jgi:hypothetical protein
VKIVGRRILPILAVFALCACRNDRIESRRVAKESVASPDVATAAARPRGVRWKAPAGWTEVAASGMRVATLIPPAAPGKAEASVAAFPGDVGGELANVNRWRGQIALPPMTDADLPRARRTLRCPLGTILVYDFTATGTSPARVVAGMITVNGVTWFFKLDGDARAVAADKPAFVHMLEGIAGDAS